MRNQTELIPVYDISVCKPGTNLIIKKTEGSILPEYLSIPHRNRDFSICLLLEGEINHFSDFEMYNTKGPALIMLAPDHVHQYAESAYYKMIQVTFTKEMLLNETEGVMACWEYGFRLIQIPVHDKRLLQELLLYLTLMEQEYKSARPQKEVVLKNLLNAFITASSRLVQCKNSSLANISASQNKIVRQFKTLTDQHFLKYTQVAQYADMLYITPGHLNDLIKSFTGKTAKQVIDERRIVEAKRLLFWGQLSAKEIASHMNFEDDAYFNRFFKKHTGTTPALFQRNTREKYN